MRGRKQLSLLVVRGDGVRVLRLNVPRALVSVAFVLLAGGVALTGALVGDWVQLRELTREARTLRRQLAEQRAAADAFQRRVVELRREMASWKDLNERIWEPFGPELAPGGRDRGIGGAPLPSDTPPARLTPRDELERLAEVVREQGEGLRALERLMSRAGRALATLPSRWPVRGAVNSEFGMRQSPWGSTREFHAGMDIRAMRGTPVRAPAPGSVVFAGVQPDYGNTVIIDHGRDIRSLYGHLSRLHVRTGQTVERGQVIALSGNTGRSSGPHLHYGITVQGKPVNPRLYLWD